LAIDGARSGSLFNAYRDKREVAEDCLARKVDPLDEDLAAWLSFLDAWTKSPDPDAMLSRSGLNANDVSRLKRRWAKRMEDDPTLGIEAAKIAAQGRKPMPTITVAAAMLRPFPWSKRGEVKAVVAKATVAADAPVDVSLDQYARVCAELAMVAAQSVLPVADSRTARVECRVVPGGREPMASCLVFQFRAGCGSPPARRSPSSAPPSRCKTDRAATPLACRRRSI
jgi:hypothetical protein